MLQRLADLPIKNFEAIKKYADDPNAISFLGGQFNQENALLSRQAVEIIKILPPDKVSSTELYSVAVALQFSYQNDQAKELYALTLQRSDTFNDTVAAQRGLANLYFLTGEPEKGRVKFQEALEVFSKYSGYNSYTRKSTHIQTRLNWASAEAGMGFIELAEKQLILAKDIVTTIDSGPGRAQLGGQIDQAYKQIIGFQQ
ncbi:MAG: hypothetical protein D3924_09850 [Candidatus Electrothrix sp. AR4]|nr:hypothetical protein [Candidatus Electrothrix sp. AR4]